MLMPSVALKNGCASGGSVSFPLTFSISLIGMSELLPRSAVLADYFFHNAFRHASESPESGSLLVHRSEELLPFAIDEADFAEVTITSLFPESSPRASSVRVHVPRARSFPRSLRAAMPGSLSIVVFSIVRHAIIASSPAPSASPESGAAFSTPARGDGKNPDRRPTP